MDPCLVSTAKEEQESAGNHGKKLAYNYIVAVIMSYLPKIYHTFTVVVCMCNEFVKRFAAINYAIQSIWIIWNCCCCFFLPLCVTVHS